MQGTLATKHAGALILFDISGFFDNINPEHVVAVLKNRGFPNPICEWTRSFLMGRMASLKVGDHISESFPISYGTLQGSPLSPILSALYTSPMLHHSKEWSLRDLTLYMDDGTIYVASATPGSAVEAAKAGLIECVKWLDHNGLAIDANKTELMIFQPQRASKRRFGTAPDNFTFIDPNMGAQTIKSVKTL